MKNAYRSAAILLIIMITCCTAGCSGRDKTQASLTVSAAASLTDAITEIRDIFLAEHTDISLELNFAASGILEQQIEHGAPVDVFIAASPKYMDMLEQKELIHVDSRRDLLCNRIVLVTPAEDRLVDSIEELADHQVKRIALADPDISPAGRYGKEVLVSMGVWDAIASRLIIARDVRQVLAYVETGEVDAGIVYQTDAGISPAVMIAAVAPENSHTPIVYPAAVISGSQYEKEAGAFVEFMTGDTAASIFEKYGFSPIRSINDERD